MKISLRSSPLMPSWLTPQGNDVLLSVWISSRATRTRVMGTYNGRLRIQLAAPPVDGRANQALVRFVAETLRISRAQVVIAVGLTSPSKAVRVLGVPAQRVLLALAPPRPA